MGSPIWFELRVRWQLIQEGTESVSDWADAKSRIRNPGRSLTMANRKKGKILLTCGLTALIVILFCPPWNLRAATAWPMGGKRYTERFVGWHFLTCSSVTLAMLFCDNGLRPVQMEVAGFGLRDRVL
jgi:hypothetical protein